MTAPPAEEAPGLTLVTPPGIEPGAFAALLDRLLAARRIDCLRIDLPGLSDAELAAAAAPLRAVAGAHDVATVIRDRIDLVAPLGLDGVHLPDGARRVRFARKSLGPDRIVGAFCGLSRHDAMTAAEAGADYVAAGPMDAEGIAFVHWWSDLIVTPLVAEGGLDAATRAALDGAADFLALGPEIWEAPEGPLAALRAV